MTPNLTARQARFVQEYLLDLNSSAAARRAGYASRNANVTGPRLLANVRIAAAIDAAMTERSARTRVNSDAVVRKLAAVAFADVRRLFTPDGALKSIAELSEDEAAFIAGMDVVTVLNDNGSATRTTKVRFNDRLRALELLGKHLGLFEPKAAPGTAENPIAVLIRHAQGTALPVVANPPPGDEDDDEDWRHSRAA